MEALALVVCYFLGDVVLENADESGIIEAAIGHPIWSIAFYSRWKRFIPVGQLVVPH